MAFDWIGFLHVADYLYDLDEEDLSHEACCRVAISRAYYAAYCYARNYAEATQGFKRSQSEHENDHRRVYEHFKSRRGGHGVASRLKELRQWRNAADYDDEVGGLISQTEKILDTAGEAIAYLK
jgi:hypothetical protein